MKGRIFHMENRLFITPEYVTAKEVKKVRAKLGLTQKEFSKLINCSKITVERWETSKEKRRSSKK